MFILYTQENYKTHANILIYRPEKEGFEVTMHALRPENIHKIYHDMDKTEQKFIETLIYLMVTLSQS